MSSMSPSSAGWARNAFSAVEFASNAKSDHSVLTEQRQEEGVRRVVDFMREKLLA
jgi:hypothetical protein